MGGTDRQIERIMERVSKYLGGLKTERERVWRQCDQMLE